MRRNLSGLFKRPFLAIVFALALTLLLGGVASAATTSSRALSSSTSCITASPPTQTVEAGQAAKFTVTISCYPPEYGPGSLYLVATWGDGTTSQYLLCGEVACMTPPVTIATTHVYPTLDASTVYYPNFCMEPLPANSSTVPECVSVQVIVN